LKTNDQLLNEITALMADAWLAACERRVISSAPLNYRDKFLVVDVQENFGLFGPSTADECRLYVHRMAALDVLRALGTERVAEASMFAAGNGKIPAALNG
jgi:hypothetical protein